MLEDLAFVLASSALLLFLCGLGWLIGWRCVLSRFSVAQKLMREVFGVGETRQHQEHLAAARAKRLERRSIRARFRRNSD
jgi:hypothetical protein